MDIYDLLNNYKTIKKYKDDNISDDLIKRTLDRAIRTPSAGNLLAYKVLARERFFLILNFLLGKMEIV